MSLSNTIGRAANWLLDHPATLFGVPAAIGFAKTHPFRPEWQGAQEMLLGDPHAVRNMLGAGISGSLYNSLPQNQQTLQGYLQMQGAGLYQQGWPASQGAQGVGATTPNQSYVTGGGPLYQRAGPGNPVGISSMPRPPINMPMNNQPSVEDSYLGQGFYNPVEADGSIVLGLYRARKR